MRATKNPENCPSSEAVTSVKLQWFELDGNSAWTCSWVILRVKNFVMTGENISTWGYNKVWRLLCLDRMSFWWCTRRKVKTFWTADNPCVCAEGKEWEIPTSTAISMVGMKVMPINHNLFHLLHLPSHPFPTHSDFALSKFLHGALCKISTSENTAYHFNTDCLWCQGN